MRLLIRIFDLVVPQSSHLELRISLIYLLCPSAAKLVDFCTECARARMAGVPHGAFAAVKVRSNLQRNSDWQKQLLLDPDHDHTHQHFYHVTSSPKIVESLMETPMKYNSKMMNSIWGLYNRYSVHNFKKNTDGKNIFIGGHQLNAVVPQISFKGIYFATEHNK